MDGIHVIFDYLSGQAVWWGLLVLTGSAMIEYIVPPFPGDTVTIAGAVLVVQAEWPWWGVFAAVMLGSMAGAGMNWWLGSWLADHEDSDTWVHDWMRAERVAPKLARLKEQFRRRGAVYIAMNRFLPAFRSLFFIAAGLSGLTLAKVLLFAAVSAGVWNGALMGVGLAVGYNLEALAGFVRDYTQVVWGLLLMGAAGWAVVKWARRPAGRGGDGAT